MKHRKRKIIIASFIVLLAVLFALIGFQIFRYRNRAPLEQDGVLRIDPTFLEERSAYAIGQRAFFTIRGAGDFQLAVEGTWNGNQTDRMLTKADVLASDNLKRYYDLLMTGLDFLPESFVTDGEKQTEGDRMIVSFGLDGEKVNGLIDRFASSQAFGLEDCRFEMVFDRRDGSLLSLQGFVASQKFNGEGSSEWIRVYHK